MTAEQVSRAAVLAYRAAAHDLEQPAATLNNCGVLEVGVQDTPPGTSASLALRARLSSPVHEDAVRGADLVLVHSLRAAMHVHRPTDLALLAAALRPDDPGEAGALDKVAAAMRQTVEEAQTCTKGELSTRLSPLLPVELTSWCPTCRAEHVPDGLFRAATLPAGLHLRQVGNRSAVFARGAIPDRGDTEAARRELLRRFLRRCGPATAKDLAAWTGTPPPAARKWWGLAAGDLVEVRVDDQRAWMHPADLDDAREASTPTVVRLLPPYDRLTEIANRQLLVPDATIRQQVWRAVANPGVVLIAGELAATWRRRKDVITVTPLAQLSTDQRRAIRDAATADGPSPDVDVVFDG